MGKKTRKTRWRTLPIGDEQSDSSEDLKSDTRNGSNYHNHDNNNHHNQKYYNSNKFIYSSQSTPIRRYQNGDGSTKSTRSSSTASENKITFNEDEYMRITTPRQDVLFKKGYLNKPKTYSTQTSTGNSTTSTGNSTGNGTPDYHNTDLEYESQFVYPNGFMDQNGIYYINSYDPYPLMVYNPPTYYNGTDYRSKKYSTESLAETTSTTNEENSQDGEVVQTPSPSNGQHHQLPITNNHNMYNMVYPPPFYYNNNNNGLCTATAPNNPQELVNGHHQSEVKRIKRRRRRKVSSSKENGTTSEYTEDEDEYEDDEEEEIEVPTKEIEEVDETRQTNGDSTKTTTAEPLELNESDSNEHYQTNTADNNNSLSLSDKKYDLKPDAQEFVPRSMRPENLQQQQQQYFKIPPNFVPVPILNPLGAQNYNHAYIPPGIPVNFIQQYPPGFVPPGYGTPPITPSFQQHPENAIESEEIQPPTIIEPPTTHNIDINTVVSKLEQVANEPKKIEKRNGYHSKKHFPNKIHEEQTTTSNKQQQQQQTPPPRKIISHNTLTSPRKFNTGKFASSPRKYSETVKKPPAQLPTQQVKPLNKPAPPEVTNNTPPRPPQWISVSSKKKRRNRNVEEVDEFEKEPIIKMLEVSELEKELLNNVNKLEQPQLPEETKIEEKLEVQKPQLPEETKEVVVVVVEETKTKRKPKKNSTKNSAAKRVIITDSLPEVEEVKPTETPKTSPEPEEIVPAEVVPTAPMEPEESKISVEPVQILSENPEIKKSKKKKKKSKVQENSASPNPSDDTYNFLGNSTEKTNMEVSQELDLIIQRGMYNSLEEKIKSLNIIPVKEEFFQSVIRPSASTTTTAATTSRESSIEKTPPEISKFLSNSMPKFKYCMASVSTNEETTDVQQLTTSKNGLFVENLEINELLNDIYGKEKTPLSQISEISEQPQKQGIKEKKYPITQAVKNWMTKTRENTPEIEILKSPSTIFKELRKSISEDDDEDVTVYSATSGHNSTADLLECWENEIPSNSEEHEKTCEDDEQQLEVVEQNEEDVEVYESKFGQNADYLEIQKEIEEKKRNFPKHGALPYRAICCSLM